ncbi:MAG: hypothetical protein JRH11_12860 [Deltaproteobacteria bacterium]|nr:hypothetical protein [Deltaproteobacteria bacterium]
MSNPPDHALDERASSPPSPTLSESAVVDALHDHRRALADGDVEAVRASMAWGARPPWERDLLLDLSAAEGLPEAVTQLRKFWDKAQAQTRGVRPLSNGDVEVFEFITMPDGRELSTVTLMRPRGDRYLVVSTADAADDTIRLLILSEDPDPEIDDVRFTREWTQRFGATAHLLLDGQDGALGHTSEEWLARVRGPIPWEPIRQRFSRKTLQLPGAICAFEVAMTPPEDRETRKGALEWLGRGAGEVAAHVGADWIYVQRAEKLITTKDLRKALAISSGARGLTATFVRLVEADGWASTRGLGQMEYPELEIEICDWPDGAAARRLVGSLAVAFIDGRVPPHASGPHIINVGQYRVRLALGRRGSERGRTHGVHGALVVRPADMDVEVEVDDRLPLIPDPGSDIGD